LAVKGKDKIVSHNRTYISHSRLSSLKDGGAFIFTLAAQFTLHFIGHLCRVAFTQASHKARELHQVCDAEKRSFLAEHHLWIRSHKVGPLEWNGANRLTVHLQQQPPPIPVVALAEANQLSPAERMERMRYPDKMRCRGDIACILD